MALVALVALVNFMTYSFVVVYALLYMMRVILAILAI